MTSPGVDISNKPSPQLGDWTGIIFTDSSKDGVVDGSDNYISGSTIQFADISYGGTILGYSSCPFIANNNIHDNRGQGITYPHFYPW